MVVAQHTAFQPLELLLVLTLAFAILSGRGLGRAFWSSLGALSMLAVGSLWWLPSELTLPLLSIVSLAGLALIWFHTRRIETTVWSALAFTGVIGHWSQYGELSFFVSWGGLLALLWGSSVIGGFEVERKQARLSVLRFGYPIFWSFAMAAIIFGFIPNWGELSFMLLLTAHIGLGYYTRGARALSQ